jgi:predicted DNA-binding transcriptional regulator YafY
VLPEHRTAPATGWGLAAFPFAEVARGFVHMPAIRAALKARQKLRLTYRSLDEALTERVVRPLQMEYWGRVWTLTAWCELRHDFGVFRVDRVDRLEPLAEQFEEEDGKTLADYLARYAQGPDGN